MTSSPVFSPRLLIGWLAAGVLIFAASLFLGGAGDGGKPGADSVGPSAFSRSAVGYAGIAEILHRLDIPVVKSRYNALGKLHAGGVLVITDPRPMFDADAIVGRDVKDARTLLLVLPKWTGAPSQTHQGWIESATMVNELSATWALNLVVPKGQVVRPGGILGWSQNQIGTAPSLDDSLQLIHAKELKPIVANADGILVGEMPTKGRRLWVLADPDVMDNHGLGRQGNAAFSVALIDALRGGAGNVVFDETIHGYVAAPASPLKLMFQFPFVFATLQGLLAVALLLWATVGRFGAPAAATTALEAGKLGLVENTAKLLEFAGHHRMMVRRYVQASVRDVARVLRAPRGLSDGQLVDWLQRVGAARGVATDVASLCREVEAGAETARLTAIAGAIHQWKGEILNGPAADSRRH
jgi:hypothetical protein